MPSRGRSSGNAHWSIPGEDLAVSENEARFDQALVALSGSSAVSVDLVRNAVVTLFHIKLFPRVVVFGRLDVDQSLVIEVALTVFAAPNAEANRANRQDRPQVEQRKLVGIVRRELAEHHLILHEKLERRRQCMSGITRIYALLSFLVASCFQLRDGELGKLGEVLVGTVEADELDAANPE